MQSESTKGRDMFAQFDFVVIRGVIKEITAETIEDLQMKRLREAHDLLIFARLIVGFYAGVSTLLFYLVCAFSADIATGLWLTTVMASFEGILVVVACRRIQNERRGWHANLAMCPNDPR